MYSLLARIPEGLDPLRTRFEAHVRRAGLSAIEKIADTQQDAKDGVKDNDAVVSNAISYYL